MANASLLHLVRHGESLGNVDPTRRRRDDPPLTDRGRAQAARVAAALARAGIDHVFSSPLRRARETAEAIAAATGLTARIVQGLGEVDMGSLSDAETPSDRTLREAIFAEWLAGERGRGFPGGEDFAAVARRVRDGLHAVARAAPGARVAVVTHRIPIAAAAEACDAAGGPALRGACPNGSITTLQAGADGRWRLVAWGDARHLA